jgi:coenzyme F420-dependent glucose-6-phosphate dehydrogenase
MAIDARGLHMENDLILGWKAGCEQYSPGDLLKQAVAADRTGFDSINVSDHFHPWSEDGQSCFTWTWLGAAAALVKRIELGTGVTCPILRYHPAVIAQAMATVDFMSPGPTYLGLGTGEALNEYSAVGKWPDYNVRQDMLRESIDLIRALWTGDKVSFCGYHYCSQDAKLYTKPKRDIPIFISSLVPESAYFAGQYGDGLITGGNSPDVLRQILDNFDQGARDAGKDPAAMPKQIECFVAYTDEEETAMEEWKKYWAGTKIHAMLLQRLYTPKMSATNGSVVSNDVIRKTMCISKDPGEQAQYAQNYIDMGFNRLYFHSAGPDQLAFIKGYAGNVLPLIRLANG